MRKATHNKRAHASNNKNNKKNLQLSTDFSKLIHHGARPEKWKVFFSHLGCPFIFHFDSHSHAAFDAFQEHESLRSIPFDVKLNRNFHSLTFNSIERFGLIANNNHVRRFN
jgi:hypothetical protein